MAYPGIIELLDGEIARLREVRAMLQTPEATKGPGRPKGVTNIAEALEASPKTAPKRTMSAEARARIAAAQKTRWANQKQLPGAEKKMSKPVIAKNG